MLTLADASCALGAALHWAALCAEGDGAMGGLKLLLEHAPDATKGLINGQSSSSSTQQQQQQEQLS